MPWTEPKEMARPKEKVKSNAPAKMIWEDIGTAGLRGGAEPDLGTDGPECFPHTCPSCGGSGHRAVHCGRPTGQGCGKRGAYGVHDEAAEEAEPKDIGTLTCALCGRGRLGNKCWGSLDNLPPGLIDPESFDPRFIDMVPTPGRGRGPWKDQLKKDTRKTHRRHPPPGAARASPVQSLHSLHEQVRRFSQMMSASAQIMGGHPPRHLRKIRHPSQRTESRHQEASRYGEVPRSAEGWGEGIRAEISSVQRVSE